MRTTQLEYFVSAARSLSFTEAARECHVAQPAISQQVRQLEAELGFPLFVRGARGLALTDAGRAYYPAAEEVLARLRDARLESLRIASGATGMLTIGTAGATQGTDLRVLDRFRERMPGVSLAFRTIDPRRVGRQLVERAFDVTYIETAQLEGMGGVRFAAVETQPLCVMVNVRHPLARARGVTLATTARQTLLFAEPSEHASASSVLGQLRALGAGSVSFADSQDDVQLMLRLNMGVVVAPQSVATSIPDDVTLVPTLGRWPCIRLGWAYRADNDNPALAAFLAFADDASHGSPEPLPAANVPPTAGAPKAGVAEDGGIHLPG